MTTEPHYNPFHTSDPLEALRFIAESHAAPGPQRDLWINHWFVIFDRWVDRVASGSMLNYGRGRAYHLRDDIAQITRMACLEIITDCCEGTEDASQIRSLKAMVQLRTRNNIRDEIEKHDQRGVTRATSKFRRSREMDIVEHDLAQKLMRQPKRAEIIAEFRNRQSGRKDARRQGREPQLSDVGFHQNTPAPTETDQVHYDEDPDCVITPMEGDEFRAKLISRAHQHSAQLGAAAEAFLHHSLVGKRTEFGVMEAIRLHASYESRRQAKAAVDEIRWISRTVLSEDYGISEDDL